MLSNVRFCLGSILATYLTLNLCLCHGSGLAVHFEPNYRRLNQELKF